MDAARLLLAFVPLSLILAYIARAPALWLFLTGVIAIVPLAEWMRRATEQLARRAGPAVGGIVNTTFGNLAELLLAIFILAAGKGEVVKGQITGSIIGNSLLGLGLASLVGGWGREKQTFSRERVGLLSNMLLLALIALLLPALFDYTERNVLAGARRGIPRLDEALSLGVSVVLLLVYGAGLFYAFFSRRDVYELEEERDERHEAWSVAISVAVLVAAAVLTALEADVIAGALEPTARSLGFSEFFMGIVVLAVVGNAAEYVSAVYFARTDRMGLVMSITVGSSIQVALVVAPILVIASFLLGRPMNLVFSNPLELVAIAAAAFTVNAIAHDGQSNWFEGVLLLAVYTLLGLVFFFT